MAPRNLHFFELLEAGRRVQAGDVSAVELTEAMLRRIDRKDRKLKSYARVTPELALKQARRADAEFAKGRIRGPLHGVPVAVKDLCYTRGIVTAAGMPIHAGFRPPFDATVVTRLAEAGAVLLGKLQMTEGAFGDHHPEIARPINPWDATRCCGASSSGSGVATAAGLCFAALGSDTGGSIRFPAAANGITGLKPTWGRVSRHGVFDLAPSLDTVGPMCRSAADCGAVLGAIAGADDNDPTAVPLAVPNYLAGLERGVRGLRLGVDQRYNRRGVDAATVSATDAALAVLREAGAEVRRVRMPDSRQVADDWLAHCAVETAHVHRETWPAQKDRYGGALGALIGYGHTLSAIDHHRVLLNRHDFAGRLRTLFEDIDLLLVPVLATAAPTLQQMAAFGERPDALSELLRFSAPFNASGSPTITLPAGETDGGAPVAVQLVGRHFEEDLLVRAGHAFQRETDWHRRHPSV